MKLLGRIHIPTLLFLALLATPLLADDLRLFYANNPAWKSDVAFSAPNGATFPATQLYPPSTVPVGGSRLIENFGGAGFGVQTISVDGSGVRAWTEARFNDGQTTNSIEIPPLPAALDPSGVYTFEGIESVQRGRSTYLAMISDAPTSVAIDVFDGANHKVGSESATFTGFVFYKLVTSVLIGRVEVRIQSGQNFGWPINGKVYAVAFVGRDSGKPRVEVPTLRSN